MNLPISLALNTLKNTRTVLNLKGLLHNGDGAVYFSIVKYFPPSR